MEGGVKGLSLEPSAEGGGGSRALLHSLHCHSRAGVTPGYGDEVIFADGTFIDGSTAELSADGPLRSPYVVYTQGGTHWTHWAYVLEEIVSDLRSAL